MKEIYAMQSASIFENISHEQSTHDWQRIPPRKGKCGTLFTDKVYARVTTRQAKHQSASLKCSIYIGINISKLLGFSIGEYLDVCFDNKNPYYLKIKKIDSNNGYKLGKNTNGTNLKFEFICSPHQLLVSMIKTVPIDFNISNDKSMLIDFTRFKL